MFYKLLCKIGLHDFIHVDLVRVCRRCGYHIPKDLTKHRHLPESMIFYLVNIRGWVQVEENLYKSTLYNQTLPLVEAYTYEIENCCKGNKQYVL